MESIKNKGWLLVFILIVGYTSIKSVVKEIEVMYHPIRVQYPLTGNGLDTPVAIDTSGSSPILTSYDHELADKTWWNSNLTATGNRTHNANKKFSLVNNLDYWWTKAGVITPSEFKQDSLAIGLKAGQISITGYSIPFISCDEGDQQIVINPGASGDIRIDNLQTVNDPSVVVSIDGGTGQLYKSPISESTYSPGGSGSNLDSDPTFTDAIYTQFGNNVWLSGHFTADPTTTSTTTQVSFTPPIYDSDFASDSEAGGVAFCGTIAGMGASIHARTGTHSIIIEWISTNVSSQTWTYFLQYRIIH